MCQLDPLRLGSNQYPHDASVPHGKVERLRLGALGIDGEILNPIGTKRKGDGRGLSQPALLEEAGVDSLSCPPTMGRWRDSESSTAGIAWPCLIRRAALMAAAGATEAMRSTEHRAADLRAQPLDTRESPGKQVRPFQHAIERLRGDRSYEPL